MLQSFVITLREGLEAFLIVAISLAYLRKAGRRELIPAVHWGIAIAVGLSIGAAYLFSKAANQALWEGILGIAAAVSVASLTVHMWRTARRIKGDIEGHLKDSALKQGSAAFLGVFGFTLLMITREGMETALLMGTLWLQIKSGAAAFWGVFGFTLLMITREGMETAMLMNALIFQVKALNIVGGAVAGTLLSGFVAYLWSRYGHRVNLARFFQVTAIFLLVFVVQLFIYGFHELAEAHVLPNSDALHWATEPYGPDGVYGHYLTYLLVALPLGWLAISSLFGGKSQGQRSQAA